MKTRWMKKAMAILLVLAMAAGAAAGAAENAVSEKLSTYYEVIAGHIKLGNYDTAKEYVDKALKICTEEDNPDVYADLHLKAACIYSIKEDYEAALKELEESLRVCPDVAEAYLVRQEIYAKMNEPAKAVADLEKYIALSGDTSMNGDLANLYLQMEETQKAEESLRALAEASTDDPEAVPYNLALYEMNAGMYVEALANLQSCSKDSNKFPALYYNSGVCQMKTGAYEDAVKSFTDSLEKEDFRLDATFNRAASNMSMEAYEPAIDDFTAYIDAIRTKEPAEPTEEQAGEPETEAPAETGDQSEPAEQTEEAEDDQVDEAYYYRAACYFTIGKYTEAAEDFTVCIDGGLNTEECLFNRATSRLLSGDYEGAKSDYTVCIDREYNADDSTFNRSVAFLGLEDYDAALADLNSCIDRAYSLGKTYKQRALVYQVMGDDVKYLSDLETALQYMDD